MKSKNEIIEELYKEQFVEKYIHKIGNSLDIENFDDEVQEIYLIITQQPEERLQKMYEKGGLYKVQQFVSGIISRQIKSRTSPIFYKYKKNNGQKANIADYTTEAIEQQMEINNIIFNN